VSSVKNEKEFVVVSRNPHSTQGAVVPSTMLLPLLLRAAQQRLFSSSVQRSKRARVAVIGSGRMGKIRANLLSAHPRIELVGIVDAFSSQSKESLSKSLFVPFFDSLKDLSSNGVVDGLVVCTPTNTHATVIHDSINSLEGIKGVFVEKPVDENAFKIQSLFETTNKNNIKLCSGFQRRFDPSYASLLQNVHSGKIGQPLSGNIFFGDHPVPSLDFLLQGGDIFMDLSAHDIDFLLQVFQEDPVQSVFASGISGSPELKAAKVYDNATMVLTFESGKLELTA
jgi:myo-inositol 2-dehydrogenase/D-chiro-inositol 1-dehydrogenase